MRPRFSSRVAALRLALLFLLSQGADALGTHRCALHDGAASQAGMAAGAHAAHHAGGGSRRVPDGGEEHGACTCVGDCCASAGVSGTPEAAVSWLPLLTTAAAPSLEAPPQVRSSRTPYLLPFAQAPPPVG